MPASPHIIDGREMEPPQPFEAVMAALATLAPDASVLLILPREPFPLFRVLANSGFAWRTERAADGSFEITITHKKPA